MKASTIQGVTIGDPWAETPKPGEKWRQMSALERQRKVNSILFSAALLCDEDTDPSCRNASADGQIIVNLPGKRNPSERGRLLRDIEERLKTEIDPALTVWLEAQGDRNRLRLLRGVKVKE